MKQITLSTLLALMLCLGLVSCARSQGSTDDPTVAPTAEETSSTTPTPTPTPTLTPPPTSDPVETPSASPSSSPTPTPTESKTPKEDKKPKKTVSLTFDDGPGSYTDEVLGILNEHDVKATFFVVGQEIKGNEDLVEELVDSGMSVQSHSWRHADLTSLGKSDLKKDLKDTNAAIEKITGEPVHCMRPPYGAVNKQVRGVASDLGMGVGLWDIDPQDWAKPGVSSIVKNVKTYHHDEAVILLHDGGGDRSQTVKALPDIIKYLKKQGYEFVLTC